MSAVARLISWNYMVSSSHRLPLISLVSTVGSDLTYPEVRPGTLSDWMRNQYLVGCSLTLDFLCVRCLENGEIVIMSESLLFNWIEFAVRFQAEQSSYTVLFDKLEAQELIAAVGDG